MRITRFTYEAFFLFRLLAGWNVRAFYGRLRYGRHGSQPHGLLRHAVIFVWWYVVAALRNGAPAAILWNGAPAAILWNNATGVILWNDAPAAIVWTYVLAAAATILRCFGILWKCTADAVVWSCIS